MSNMNFWNKLAAKDICDLPPKTDRKTKIVCTIGPKTQSVEALEALINAGMNVLRMNFSHGDHDFHLKTIRNARQAALKTKKIIAIMLDTRGPEIRTGSIKGGGEVELKLNSKFKLTTDPAYKEIGDESMVYVDYKNITKVLKIGDRVSIDDGLIVCVVEEIGENYVLTRVENSGMLGSRKGVNLPGVKVDLPAVTEKDIEDLKFGVKHGVDFIAASFVRSAEHVKEIRNILGPKGANIQIISKIENREGLDNFDSILEASDGIMVARGDLGVEIPIERVGLAQKMMIAKCNAVGKPVITATQMLESMITNPRPTRAETTDIANAVIDGSDCVMLSGETAKGDHPIKAVEVMAKICQTVESSFDYRKIYDEVREAVRLTNKKISIAETIASSAVKTAYDLKAALIITITETGNTSRLVAKYRPEAPIYCITQHKETARQLCASRALVPYLVGSVIGTESLIKRAIDKAKENSIIKSGDTVVVLYGEKEGISGTTNTLKCIAVE